MVSLITLLAALSIPADKKQTETLMTVIAFEAGFQLEIKLFLSARYELMIILFTFHGVRIKLFVSRS